MAVTYSIDTEEHIVYLKTTGDSSLSEWRETMLEVFADPQYRPGFNFLSDRRLETDVPTTEFAKGAADFLNRHYTEMGHCKWATLSNNPAIYGMQRMFSIYSELNGVEAQAFKDYEDAIEWVRLRP